MTDEHLGLSVVARDKLRTVIARSVAGLTAESCAERVAWCRAHGAHGVRVHREGDVFRLTWGGADLALVPASVLLDDGAELGEPEMVGDTPDVVPDEWTDEAW